MGAAISWINLIKRAALFIVPLLQKDERVATQRWCPEKLKLESKKLF